MARLPASGVTYASPLQDEEALHRVLTGLGVGHAFYAAAIQELYFKLGQVIGRWISDQESLEISVVGKALLTTAKNLSEASRFFSGLEDGIHSDLEITITSLAAEYLAVDPTVGTPEKARELISSFSQGASRIAHICLVARADLPDRPGEIGRRALDWYDDFTSLLLETASVAGVEPTLRKDRVTGDRSGWIFTAAQAIEPFLYPRMRSPSPEACGKRLERSLRRLRDRERQKARSTKSILST